MKLLALYKTWVRNNNHTLSVLETGKTRWIDGWHLLFSGSFSSPNPQIELIAAMHIPIKHHNGQI
jgi:hypothetical protein